VDQNNQQVGVIERNEALRMAEEAGLDLVEIRADARPPLCKIMDYGKHKYQMSKKKSASAKTKAQNEPKEVRLGRSVKIDVHDLMLREKQARKFLIEGHPVNVVQRFRGRELAHPQIGLERLQKMAENLSDVARLQTPPQMSGRQCAMVLSPDKNKIEAVKAKLAKEKAAEEAAKEASKAEDPPKAKDAPKKDDATAAEAEGGDAEEQATANA
jgi:translation initiation factor IF-3